MRAMRLPRMLRPPADSRIALALLRLFFDHSLMSLIAASLLIVVQAAYVWDEVPRPVLWAWITAFVALIAVRARWRRQVLRLDEAGLAASQSAWARRAVAGSAATGLLWAAALVMAHDPARPDTAMYCAMLACITVVASINVMAPVPLALLALATPASGTLLVLLLQRGGWTGAYTALIAGTGLAMALAIVARHARLLRESHAMRYEREGLLAQAQAARDAQTRFLAAASHDLRQPVHALGLLAAQVDGALARQPIDAELARRAGQQLGQMTQVLDSMVEALLDVSRLDAGTLKPKLRDFPLQRVFDRLAPEFAVLAEERGLQWRVRPTALWVRSDAALLESMLRNLVSNALRYTHHGGVLLAARSRERSRRVEVAVWDTGVGIAPEHQSRVFEEFVQLHNPGRDRRRGHGLGLSIVARLARLLQHPVRLDSRLGQGSRFALSLPGTSPRLLEDDTVPQPAVPLAGLCVALVEDDDAVREATAALLASWGCRVHAAAGVEPLLGQLRVQSGGGHVDRIISDWRLGEANGMDAIRALRQACGQALPALLISGEALPPGLSPQDDGIHAARKPLPAPTLRAWLSAPLK